MNEQELQNQIKSLEKEYRDLRIAMNSLANNLNNTAVVRGTLSGAGVAAESILKCIIRREKINIKTKDPNIPEERAEEIRKKEVQSLMLDDMIKLVEHKIPLNVLTNLRTIQAWRNIGSHDKGEHTIEDTVTIQSLQGVSGALSEVVMWFIGKYLNHDTSSFEAEGKQMNSESDLRLTEGKQGSQTQGSNVANGKNTGNSAVNQNENKSNKSISRTMKIIVGLVLLFFVGVYFLFSSDTPADSNVIKNSVNKSIELDKIDSQILIGIKNGEKKEVLMELVSKLNHDDLENMISGKTNGILDPSDPQGEYYGTYSDFWSKKKAAYTEIITQDISIEEYSLKAEYEKRKQSLESELETAKLEAQERGAKTSEIAEIESSFNEKKLALEAEFNEKFKKYSEDKGNNEPAR